MNDFNHIWLRGYPANAAGDSVYVGLGEQVESVAGFRPGQWEWANQRIGEPSAALSPQARRAWAAWANGEPAVTGQIKRAQIGRDRRS